MPHAYYARTPTGLKMPARSRRAAFLGWCRGLLILFLGAYAVFKCFKQHSKKTAGLAVHIHTYVYIYMHIDIHIYIYTYTYMCVCMCVWGGGDWQYAIIGVTVYAESAPEAFGNLSRAIITLFRLAAGETWVDGPFPFLSFVLPLFSLFSCFSPFLSFFRLAAGET